MATLHRLVTPRRTPEQIRRQKELEQQAEEFALLTRLGVSESKVHKAEIRELLAAGALLELRRSD